MGNLSMQAIACMKDLRRVCYWVENVLYNLNGGRAETGLSFVTSSL